MKLNINTKILGQKIILVPYKDYHVPKYHEWMQCEELQRLTASEPLPLELEYQMQKCWTEDEDKCTFIILDKEIYTRTGKEVDAMIGDTNIFIIDKQSALGELEIMIAEESARGKKIGWETAILMIIYGAKYINIKVFEAKISFTNIVSIKMFEKLGFIEKSRSDVFGEITLEKVVSDEWITWLQQLCSFDVQSH